MGSATIERADSSSEPAPRLRRVRRPLRVLGIVVGVVIALIGLEQLAFYNRILPGVHVDGLSVDRKTEKAARASIERRAAQLERDPITATFADQSRAINPADIDLKVDERGDGRRGE